MTVSPPTATPWVSSVSMGNACDGVVCGNPVSTGPNTTWLFWATDLHLRVWPHLVQVVRSAVSESRARQVSRGRRVFGSDSHLFTMICLRSRLSPGDSLLFSRSLQWRPEPRIAAVYDLLLEHGWSVPEMCFQVANMIRFLVDSYDKPVPAILEIPSKDHSYDPAQDSVLSRVKYLFSAESVASGRR
ncbi:hypothetical protein Tsubulata_037933 [Turnera subulata]|uniref:Uncharacterized protein n=1 Tax=Turnera subulata TaxID=218843 RepID=A0A9Q0FKQ3_9ROSI|nr:hypothetical protein Tsubulata_037933 [Turnera subulata]